MTPTTPNGGDRPPDELLGWTPDEVPAHRRTIEIAGLDRPGHLLVVGRLRDDRPWAHDTDAAEHIHDMTLSILVRLDGLVIVAARADMERFPHPECPGIAPEFSDLVGLSVARGYNRAVQERFGRELGCSHLEFLTRAMGPVVLQSVGSSASRVDVARGGRGRPGGAIGAGLVGSCHIWAAGGTAVEKVALGWQPGEQYPAPTLVALRRAAGRDDPSG